MGLDIHEAAMSVEKEHRRRERVEIATAAMQGFYTAWGPNGDPADQSDTQLSNLAIWCFRVADALLAEADKEPT